MHKIFMDLTDLAPDSTDRLIKLLQDYINSETARACEIQLEIRPSKKNTLVLPIDSNESIRVCVHSIRSVESSGHYCLLYLSSQPTRVRMNFSALSLLLPEEEFLCCNRGILLGMRHIQDLQDNTFIMKNGRVYNIRRRSKTEVLLKYKNYRLQNPTSQRI